MATTAPTGMRRSAWDYLLEFTEAHEALVLSMYNASASEQDVTVGIGTKLFSEEKCQTDGWILPLFHDKSDVNKPITVADVQSDFRRAAQIPRVGNVTKANLIPEYEVLQLRTTPEKARERMAVQLYDNVTTMLKPGSHGWAFENFSGYPADAQVAIASFSYARPAWDFPLLLDAIKRADFDEACKQVWIQKASPAKNIAQERIFWNAARVMQQGLDFDRVYSKPTHGPAILPWKAWTETDIDLDAGTTRTTPHEQSLNQPKRMADTDPRETL